MRTMRRFLKLTPLAVAPLVLTGCVLAPKGAKEQKVAVADAGKAYAKRFEQRELPELPAQPTWDDVLRRALLANGDIEAAYFAWAAQVAKIDQMGAYPNSPVMIEGEYMFSKGRMKSWDRTTVMVGFSPMEDLAFPTKVYQAAKVETRMAEAAGQRFIAAKFDVQRKVLRAWWDYALAAEKVRIQRENVSLLKLLNDTAAGRVRAGAAQQDLLRTDVELRMADNELRNMEAELPQMRAMLNAMLGRAADAPLDPPQAPPQGRAVPDDATLLAAGVRSNATLWGMAKEVQGGRDALELARMRYIPDINPFAGFTGSMSQVIGAAITLPTVLPRIKGMVEESRANLRRMEAMLRQTKLERDAEFVAMLVVLRNAERQATLFESQLLPAAQRVLDNVRQSYANGMMSYLDLIESQRTLLDVRVTIAESKAAREKALADLEAIGAFDVETLLRQKAEAKP